MGTHAESLYAQLRHRLTDVERERAREFVFNPKRHIPQADARTVEAAEQYADEWLRNDSHDILVRVAADALRECFGRGGDDRLCAAADLMTAGMLNTDQVSASVTLLHDQSSLVLVDRGVLSTVAALSQLLAGLWPDDFGTQLPKRGVGLLARLVTSQVRLDAVNLLLPLDLAPWRSGIESTIALHAIQFILAHELAHVALGHPSIAPTRLRLGPVEIDVVHSSSEIELAADALAADKLLEAISGTDRLLAVVGIGLVFEALELVERAGSVFRGRSHPPARMRLDCISDRVRRHDHEAADRGAEFIAPITRVLNVVRDHSLDDLVFDEAWGELEAQGFLQPDRVDRDAFAVFDLLNHVWLGSSLDHSIALLDTHRPSSLRAGTTEKKLEAEARDVLRNLWQAAEVDAVREAVEHSGTVSIRRAISVSQVLRDTTPEFMPEPVDLAFARLAQAAFVEGRDPAATTGDL